MRERGGALNLEKERGAHVNPHPDNNIHLTCRQRPSYYRPCVFVMLAVAGDHHECNAMGVVASGCDSSTVAPQLRKRCTARQHHARLQTEEGTLEKETRRPLSVKSASSSLTSAVRARAQQTCKV